jgi:hypothetical protein
MHWNHKSRIVVAALILLFSAGANAQVDIDNGIVGDGFWGVTVNNAGDSRNGVIDPVGVQGPTDVIYDLIGYYDNGANGVDGQLADAITTPAFLSTPGQVTSAGSFPGPNGTINWTAISTITPGSPLYTVQYQFSSSSAFGATRIVTYFDEDVLGAGNDVVIVIGTPGTADFQLLTLAADADIGVAMAADYFGTTSLTWAGWAIDNCCGAPAVYSIPGETGGLGSTIDPRFPDDPAYGPADVTTSMAFDFEPTATTASMLFALGGSADGTPPPPPEPPLPPVPVPSVPIPTMGPIGLGLVLVLILTIGGLALRRKRYN